jgi:hypothetical protein
MSHEEQRAARRHSRTRTSGHRDAGKRTDELLNHPSFKYTFTTQQIRGI